MKQRLCIGIQEKNNAWTALLDQLGVSFEEVNYNYDLEYQYSVIIQNKKPDKDQRSKLKGFLKKKGSLLEIGDNVVFNESKKIHSYHQKTIINDSRKSFLSHISHIDIRSKIRTHEDSSLLEGLVYIDPDAKYNLAYLGVDAGDLLQSSGYKRKYFYSQHKENPDEIVSQVSKHELSETLKSVLKELHFLRSLPYIEKWTSPTPKPVFGFRIDSDFGDKESIDQLYEIIHKHKKSATWFLHVQAHEDWLEHFKSFQNQEIALHGYEHGTSDSYKKVFHNINNGLQLLEKAGFEPTGFCAPYGIWNKALSKALHQTDFTYSSEFTFGYDGLPFQPAKEHLPLQIPIHPVCTGSLNRRQYSIKDMKSYFEQILRNKLSRFEPAFFYHHPLQPGLSVIDHLLELSNVHDFENLTFAQFATFWKERQAFTFDAYMKDNRVSIDKSSDPEKLIQVSFNHFEFDLVTTEKAVTDLTKSSKLKYSNPYLPNPNEASEMRRRNLQLLKTSLLDWKNRIRL
ncbi:MAG: polysaccharide deacetylase family protein [Gracilimonas sp.]